MNGSAGVLFWSLYFLAFAWASSMVHYSSSCACDKLATPSFQPALTNYCTGHSKLQLVVTRSITAMPSTISQGVRATDLAVRGRSLLRRRSWRVPIERPQSVQRGKRKPWPHRMHAWPRDKTSRCCRDALFLPRARLDMVHATSMHASWVSSFRLWLAN